MTDLEKRLERKKLELRIKKAETAKDEIDYKMLERERDIQRMEEHKLLQDKAIAEAKEELKNLKE